MRNILRIVFLGFLIICVAYSYSSGEGAFKKAEVITIYKGEIKVISVDNPRRVVISNPEVADVTSINKEEMVIVAKDQGTTNLIWWDSQGEHASQLEVFLEDMRPVKERIDNLLKEMNLAQVVSRSMDSEGKVLLLGAVKTAQDLERLNLALSVLKPKIINLILVKEEEAGVGIDVQLLELSKDAEKTLGFTMPTSIEVTEPSGRFSKTLRGSMDAIFHVFEWPRSNFTATLDLLVQEGKARILSQPRLSCQSGKEAELLVGGEKPILTTTVASSTGTSAGTNVDYKEYGIKLKIKPTVTEDKKIKLALNVEVSEVETAETIGSTTTTAGITTATATTALAYPLKKRNVSTELFLNDGQTMAIGGLKKEKSEEDLRKTAFLGDVPILGFFFRKRTTKTGGGQGERGDVELFITLTPTIIKEEAKPEEVKKEEGVKPTMLARLAERERIAQEALLSDYVQKVSQQISQEFFYPWLARESNLEGSLLLRLHIDYTGQLLDLEIKKSSGFTVLDENAVNIVGKASPYPAFPPEMKQKELWIDLPIIYKRE